jgi:hypothetical protein
MNVIRCILVCNEEQGAQHIPQVVIGLWHVNVMQHAMSEPRDLTSSPCTLSWLQLQEAGSLHLRRAGNGAPGSASPGSLSSAVLPVLAAPSTSRRRRPTRRRHPGC